MKFCVFGGFLFLGSCIRYALGDLGNNLVEGYTPFQMAPLWLSIMILGLALGVYGLIKKDNVDHHE